MKEYRNFGEYEIQDSSYQDLGVWVPVWNTENDLSIPYELQAE